MTGPDIGAAARSRITIVPAAMSPSRWSCVDNSMREDPDGQQRGHLTQPDQAPHQGVAEPDRRPLPRHDPQPSAALPGVRPRHSDSQMIG